jgi:hypothetical protein
MSWTYSCPYCESVVNPDETVILLGERGSTQCLMGFHPQPGNYTIYVPPGVDLAQGDKWDFLCPVCRANLRSYEHDHLCALVCWQGPKRRIVFFSRIVGERATYVVEDTSVDEKHGDHADAYNDTLRKLKN